MEYLVEIALNAVIIAVVMPRVFKKSYAFGGGFKAALCFAAVYAIVSSAFQLMLVGEVANLAAQNQVEWGIILIGLLALLAWPVNGLLVWVASRFYPRVTARWWALLFLGFLLWTAQFATVPFGQWLDNQLGFTVQSQDMDDGGALTSSHRSWDI